MSAHTQGPWRAGRGCVVADYPVPEMGGSDAVDYYGGHLIAESIAPQNIPLITAAPDLLALAREMEAFSEAAMKDAIEADAANMGRPSEHKLDIVTWTERMNHCRAAIAKATGAAA